MFRHVVRRCNSLGYPVRFALRKAETSVFRVVPTCSFFGPPSQWGGGRPRFPDDVFDAMRQFSHEQERFWRDPLTILQPWRMSGAEAEEYFMRNPIVEEDGVKKFKAFFNLRGFNPENIEIMTNSSSRLITITAKHESKSDTSSQRHEVHREFSVPEGVQLRELKCDYPEGGGLTLTAPYVPPPNETATHPQSQGKEIPIKHED